MPDRNNLTKEIDPGIPSYVTLREAEDSNGVEELHIECRFDDGQKYAAIRVEPECEELATFILRAVEQHNATAAERSPANRCQHDPFLEGWTMKVFGRGSCVEILCTVCECCVKGLARSDEPSVFECKRDGTCPGQTSVRQMCWPCQARWHRQQADAIEHALRTGEKQPQIAPRGEENRRAEPSGKPDAEFLSLVGHCSNCACEDCREFFSSHQNRAAEGT